MTPSFVLLAVQDKKIVCYVYELIDGEVEVTKTEISKEHVDVTSSSSSKSKSTSNDPNAEETTSNGNPALLASLLK